MPLASKTTLRALENNYLDQSPWFAPTTRFRLWRVTIKSDRPGYCSKYKMPLLQQPNCQRPQAVVAHGGSLDCHLSARRQGLAVKRKPGAKQSPCRLAGPAGGQGLHPASDKSTGCGATLVEECGRWPPNDLCSPFCFPSEHFS